MSHRLRRPAWAMLVALLAAPMGSCLQDDIDDDDAAAAAPVGSPNTGMTGDYFAVAFDSNPPSPATDSPTSFTGVWTFDGVGGFTATWTASEDDSIWVETGAGTYAISSDGLMTMEEAAGHYSLGVRKGGRAAAGAALTAAEPPRFVLGLRR